MANAPGELELVRQLVNTFDVEERTDAWRSPTSLHDWLVERELLKPSERVSESDLTRARGFREALRRLLLANNGGPSDAEAAERVSGAAGALRARFDATGGVALVAADGGFDGALAQVAAIVLRADADGTWRRLKVCADHTCEAAFYDRSKNRSGTWCSMRVCGNRAKARSYRRRRAA